MFHSQSLSRRGPLGSIWVAAYCHKRLKKAQVTATDIPFSVDKILQDEFEITYRVLGYFLLGVVRIYSKKVEYLFNDCNKMLIQVKGFVVTEEVLSRASKSKFLAVPMSSISRPKRFELDAFDLEVGDYASGAHEMPQEEITLKDNSWRHEGRGQYTMQKYTWEDIAGTHDVCPTDYTEAEDSVPVDFMDAEVGVERLQRTMFSQEENASFMTYEDHQSRPCDEDNQGEREQMRNPEEASRSEHDKCFSDEEHDLSNLEAIIERLQEDVQLETRYASLEVTVPSGRDMCLVEGHGLRNFETTIERLREDEDSPKEKMEFEVVAPLDGGTEELGGAEAKLDFASGKENEPSETVPFESPEPALVIKDQAMPLRVDLTPPAKLPNTAKGGSTPEFMLIPTPSPMERPRTKRKRKCLFDDLIVLPNDLVKNSIQDASDLVCKRRKAPDNVLTAWKSTRTRGFSEPLIHYTSSELRSLHCVKKLKISVPHKDVKLPEKVDVSEPASGDKDVELPERVDLSDPTPGDKDVELPERVDLSEPTPGDGSSEQAGIAPETPIRQFSSRRPFESPKASKSYEIRPESPFEGMALEKESFVDEDRALGYRLMNEDLTSLEGQTDKLYGWTARTRIVARHLDKVFHQEGEGEAASLLQISKGRTQKESARLFYEILVLKCKDYISVEQETAYTDVLMRKLPKWEEASKADSPELKAALTLQQ